MDNTQHPVTVFCYFTQSMDQIVINIVSFDLFRAGQYLLNPTQLDIALGNYDFGMGCEKKIYHRAKIARRRKKVK